MVEKIVDRVACWVSWPRGKRTVFFSQRPGLGGPGTFSHKLIQEFQQQEISTTFRRLRGSEAALMFSVSWGDWFYRLCRRMGVRTALRVDGFMLSNYFDNREQPTGHQDRRLKLTDMALNYRLQRDLLLADQVIYQSAFSKQMADRFLYCRRGNYRVVHNGVNLSQFCPGSPREGRRRLLSAGTLRDEYMLGTVLPVFECLRKRYDLELLVVGSMAPICQQQIHEYLENYPDAADRVKVVGPVTNSDLSHWLHEADVLLHPRLGDWCPNVVIEALACGLPIVCGSWGGTAELVGDAGVVVTTGEWTYGDNFVTDLSAGVETVLAELEQSKFKARSRAESMFDISKVAATYADVMGISC